MSLVYGLHSRDVERLFGLLSRLPGPVKQLMVGGYLAWSRFRLARLKGPVRLIHYVTARCTRKCIYCFYAGKLSDDTGKELTLQENEAWVSTLPERVQVVSLTGGEPFLRPDLPELAEVYWRCNRTPKISINTNGDLPERAEKACLAILARTGLVLNLTVSIQAPEDLEPSSPVAETLHRFARLQRENPRISQVSGLTTVTRENLASLPSLFERLAGRFSRPPEIFHKLQFVRGIPGNVFAPPSAPLSDLTPSDFERLALLPAQQQQVIELSRSQMATTTYKLQALRQLLFLEAAVEVARRGGPVVDCVAGRIDAVVFQDGDVSICENFRPFASLRDFGLSFARLWSSETAVRARRYVKGCGCTHPCNLTTSMSYDPVVLRRMLGRDDLPNQPNRFG